MSNLHRFLTAQETSYEQALTEIKNGSKQSHWMWYIFPQIAGLGFSDTSKLYAIKDKAEAQHYLNHPVLGTRLVEISKEVLALNGKTAPQVFGTPDDTKLRSCMTLFGALENTDPVFREVLDKYFNGIGDPKTMTLLQ